MEPVKRIDIVIAEVALAELTTLLARHSVGGYTVTRGLSGLGDRGAQPGDGLAGEFSNAAVLVVCQQAQISDLMSDLRALLKRFGGLCLQSDALWLKH